MKVRTIRDHYNGHGDSYEKSGSAGPIYDVPEIEARNLIQSGYVEAVDEGPTAADETTAEVPPKSRNKKAG